MPSSNTVAEMVVRVSADTAPATKELNTFSSSLGNIGGLMGTAFAGAAVAGIGAVAAGLSTCVTAAADFEKTMSGVKAVSGATAEEMAGLSDLALQLGKDTSFSASEAAAGIEELVKGGLTIPDIMNGAAEATLNLAAAGGVSLPEAATIAANALAQFNLAGEDMAHVSDLIAGAANASALDVTDFSYSLKAAGAVASTVGFSFDDLAEAIAVMGKAGITGSDAGTSLKTMMLNLQPSTNAQRDLFRDLGITTLNAEKAMTAFRTLGLDPANASMEDAEDVLKKAITGWDGLKKMTADQEKAWIKGANELGIYNNAFFDANGSVRSMAEVAQVLQDSLAGMTDAQRIATLETMFGSDAIRAGAVLAKEGAAGFDAMADSMGKVTAASVGAERLNNLSGAWEQLKGSLETAAIIIGRTLLPALTALTLWVTGAINAVIPVLEQIGDAFEGMITPELAAQLQATMQEIRATFVLVFGEMATTSSTQGTAISSSWSAMLTLMVSDANSYLRELLGLVRAFALAAKGDWSGAWEEMTKVAQLEQDRQRRQFEANGVIFQGAIDTFTGGALTATRTWMAETATAIETGWAEAVTRTRTGMALLLAPIAEAYGAIETATGTVMRAVANILTAIWQEIETRIIRPRLDAIGAAVAAAWDAAKTKTEEVLGGVLAFVRDTVFEPMRAAIETSVNAARDLFAAAVDAIKQKADAVLGPLVAWWRDTVFEPMRAAVADAMAGPTGATTTFVGKLGEIKTAVDTTLGAIKTTWETTWLAIQRAAESPKAAMDELIKLVKDLKEAMPTWLVPHSPTPLQIGLEGIMEAAKKATKQVGAFFGSVGSSGGIVRKYIVEAASDRGIDPTVALRIAHHEGGEDDYMRVGKFATGWSFWPFQLHYGGRGYEHFGTEAGMGNTFTARTGWQPGDVDAWKDSIDYALDHARRHGWGAWYGRGPAGVGEWEGIPGHASGGWVGLAGPELGWLGERGPEYVVPHHALRGAGGAHESLTLNVAIGGRVAEQIVVEGYDLAVRRGRLPVAGLRLAGAAS